MLQPVSLLSRRLTAPCVFSPYVDVRKRTSPQGSLYHILNSTHSKHPHNPASHPDALPCSHNLLALLLQIWQEFQHPQALQRLPAPLPFFILLPIAFLPCPLRQLHLFPCRKSICYTPFSPLLFDLANVYLCVFFYHSPASIFTQ